MSEEHPLRVSWSGLKRYEACRHHQQLVLAKRVSAVYDGRVFLPGTVADRAMRKWLESDDPRPGQMVSLVDSILEEHSGPDSEYVIKWRGNPRDDKAKVRAQVVKALTVLEPLLLAKVVPYRYQPELRFRTPYGVPGLAGGVRVVELVGGMDILVQDDHDDFEVMDLKITQDATYIKSTLGQLIFYSIAVSSMFGLPNQPTKASFLTPLLPQSQIALTITADDRRVMQSRIIAYAHGVWRNEWDPKEDDDGCNWCEARSSCVKFHIPDVRDDQGRHRANFAEQTERRRRARLQPRT